MTLQPDQEEPTSDPSPWLILRAGIRAIPALRYALGVAAVVATAVIVLSLVLGYWYVAVFGFVAVLVGMFALQLYASFRPKIDRMDVSLPLKVVIWTVVVAFVVLCSVGLIWMILEVFGLRSSDNASDKEQPTAPASHAAQIASRTAAVATNGSVEQKDDQLATISKYGDPIYYSGRPAGRVSFRRLPESPGAFDELVEALKGSRSVYLDFSLVPAEQSGIDNDRLAQLCALKIIEVLKFKNHTQLTNFLPLKECQSHLDELDLTGINVDVSHLAGLKKLRTLKLAGMGLSDANVGKVFELENLKALDLSSTQVTRIEPPKNHGLEKLIVVGARELKEVKLVGLSNLQQVKLEQSGDELPELELNMAGLDSLWKLEIVATGIKNFDPPILPMLSDVQLRDNEQLEGVQLNEFYGLTRIAVLGNTHLTNVALTGMDKPAIAIKSNACLGNIKFFKFRRDPKVIDIFGNAPSCELWVDRLSILTHWEDEVQRRTVQVKPL